MRELTANRLTIMYMILAKQTTRLKESIDALHLHVQRSGESIHNNI